MKDHSEIKEEDKIININCNMGNLISFEQKIEKKINELNYLMNKKEDDLKNIIN